MLHAYFTPISICFVYTLLYFYTFYGTNPLTRCHSVSSLFSTVFGFRKVLKEISAKFEISQPGIIFGIYASRRTKDETKMGHEGPTSPGGATHKPVTPGGEEEPQT